MEYAITPTSPVAIITNYSGWKNLAIAAVAREDFTLARNRLQHAEWKYWPGDGSRSTLAWIEKQERQYHEAFHRLDPESGWSFPDTPGAVVPALSSSTPRWRRSAASRSVTAPAPSR
jgi:hypothetical protein